MSAPTPSLRLANMGLGSLGREAHPPEILHVPSHALPVDTGTREQWVLEALSDPIQRNILLALNERPLPATALESMFHLPHSSLYRRLHDLRALELVGVERVEITPQGKRVEVLRTLVSKVTLEMDGGRLSIRATFRDLAQERARASWNTSRSLVGR